MLRYWESGEGRARLLTLSLLLTDTQAVGVTSGALIIHIIHSRVAPITRGKEVISRPQTGLAGFGYNFHPSCARLSA